LPAVVVGHIGEGGAAVLWLRGRSILVLCKGGWPCTPSVAAVDVCRAGLLLRLRSLVRMARILHFFAHLATSAQYADLADLVSTYRST